MIAIDVGEVNGLVAMFSGCMEIICLAFNSY